ncbi:hypothetical protein BDV10DRAFT_32028 [Aspergillus recurvatus]
MCHRISWYHALCNHQDHASTITICCNVALQCNYDCGTLETLSLPVFGACACCKMKAKLAKNMPRKTSYGFPPIMESSEDDPLVRNDELYLSGTHSEDSIDGLEVFDRVHFRDPDER